MTLALPLTADDFLAALHRGLLPPGDIWPTETSSMQSRVLRALMLTYERLIARDNNLLIDSFPSSAVELLPEWESTLGLPDPCAGPSPTLQLRQAQVVIRLATVTCPTIAYFTALAATLGYVVTVQQFAPFRVGINRAGDAVQGSGWASAWLVYAPAVEVAYFRAGRSAAGDALAAWGNPVLQCEIQRLAPAHTVVLFAYASGVLAPILASSAIAASSSFPAGL